MFYSWTINRTIIESITQLKLLLEIQKPILVYKLT